MFIGGTTWSWLYLRYRNIWAAYVSHVFADVIIFAIGWKLLFM
ncbi:MAG: CPBP family glutamic-type intramembrane protease [Planctomycetota bacterium]